MNLVGLSNLGNTCFLNSVLQCLLNSTELTDYIHSKKYKDYVIESKEHKNHRLLVNEYNRLLNGIYEYKTDNPTKQIGNISPIAFKKTLQVLQHIYTGSQQHDAHECLVFILDIFHKGLIENVDLAYDKTRQSALNIQGSDNWIKFFKKEYSQIIDLFYGQEHMTTKCVNCNNVSHTFQPFSYIQLACHSTNGVMYDNLSDAFNAYTSCEQLDSNNEWKCDKCHQNVKALRDISIWKSPKYLIIHLNRFQKTHQGNRITIKKIGHKIDFPKTLKLSSVDGDYKIYGVVNHTGNINGGHYFSYIKNGNRWYNYNDTRVSEMNGNNIVTPNAYILFYKRA